jgi:hypothetical protein
MPVELERPPFGFATYELTQTVDGPIITGDGQIDHGPRAFHWGIQHVYDDGTLRIRGQARWPQNLQRKRLLHVHRNTGWPARAAVQRLSCEEPRSFTAGRNRILIVVSARSAGTLD